MTPPPAGIGLKFCQIFCIFEMAWSRAFQKCIYLFYFLDKFFYANIFTGFCDIKFNFCKIANLFADSKSRAQELSNDVSFVIFGHKTWDLEGWVKLTPPSVSWFSSTPAGIGLKAIEKTMVFCLVFIKKKDSFWKQTVRFKFFLTTQNDRLFQKRKTFLLKKIFNKSEFSDNLFQYFQEYKIIYVVLYIFFLIKTNNLNVFWPRICRPKTIRLKKKEKL